MVGLSFGLRENSWIWGVPCFVTISQTTLDWLRSERQTRVMVVGYSPSVCTSTTTSLALILKRNGGASHRTAIQPPRRTKTTQTAIDNVFRELATFTSALCLRKRPESNESVVNRRDHQLPPWPMGCLPPNRLVALPVRSSLRGLECKRYSVALFCNSRSPRCRYPYLHKHLPLLP